MSDVKVRDYIKPFFIKQLENFASAKMLMFFLPFFFSTGFFIWITKKCFIIILAAVKSTGDANAVKIVSDTLKLIWDSFRSWCTFTVALGGPILAGFPARGGIWQLWQAIPFAG